MADTVPQRLPPPTLLFSPSSLLVPLSFSPEIKSPLPSFYVIVLKRPQTAAVESLKSRQLSS